MAPKRGSTYYLDLLRREHPAFHAGLLDGSYKSVRAACVAAGIRKSRTPLQALNREWSKASSAERAEFLRTIGATLMPSTPAHPTPPPSGVPIPALGPDRKLLPWARARIGQILDIRKVTANHAMHEMGYSKLDASLASALANRYALWKIDPALLEEWIDRNSKACKLV